MPRGLGSRHLWSHGRVLILIGAGGFLGATVRFLVGAVAGEALLITLLVNAVGSFGLGLLLFDARADRYLAHRHRLITGTGFISSFTTYSTFVADVAAVAPAVAAGYIAASYAAGIGGVLVSRIVVDRRSENGIAPGMRGT